MKFVPFSVKVNCRGSKFKPGLTNFDEVTQQKHHNFVESPFLTAMSFQNNASKKQAFKIG